MKATGFVRHRLVYGVKCERVIVVFRPEQKYNMLACLAKRAQEAVQNVGNVFEGGIRPNPRAVEKVSCDYAYVRPFLHSGFYNGPHTSERIFPPYVLPVANGAVKIAEMYIRAMQNTHYF
jgi:hypothetical protein